MAFLTSVVFLVLPVLAHCKTFTVSNSRELGDALDECNAGDKIFLQPGSYRGEFVLPELGQGKSHTLITSAKQQAKSVVISGRGRDPPIIVNGTRWALTKLTITNRQGRAFGTGVGLKQSEAFVKDLIIRDVDVAIQSEGNKVAVQNCEIHAKRIGIYMFGNESIVTGNRIGGANPCIFMDDLSCCGVVKGNRCDVKGGIFVNGKNFELDDLTKFENSQNKAEFYWNVNK